MTTTTAIEPLLCLRDAAWDDGVELEPVREGWLTLLWRFRTTDGRLHGLRVYPSQLPLPMAVQPAGRLSRSDY